MNSAPVSEAPPARPALIPVPLRADPVDWEPRIQHSAKTKWGLVALAIALGFLTHFSTRKSAPPPKPESNLLPTHAKADATENAIRFYRARVARDPEDTRSQNALAEYYLQRVQESGNEDYLPLALQSAIASLKAVPPERNFGGLLALARAEFTNHAFLAARDHALQLTGLDPNKSDAHAVLGDACLELGDYDRADRAFQKMRALDERNPGVQTRLGRLAFLRGSIDQAEQHFNFAIVLLRAWPNSPNEPRAWCQWQLGETAFAIGNYRAAENHYREALQTAPNYFRALAGMGHVRAGLGDIPGAINYYEQAARIVPTSDFMAILGDLYQSARRNKDAAARYELVEQLSEHSHKVHGTIFDRRLALFHADHDLKTEEAYALAQAEYVGGRRDIYGADALAWTALKSGRTAEAQLAIKEALRLGTVDARLFYHAGMIAMASGDKSAGLAFLKRALALNPHFDPLQCENARRSLR